MEKRENYVLSLAGAEDGMRRPVKSLWVEGVDLA